VGFFDSIKSTSRRGLWVLIFAVVLATVAWVIFHRVAPMTKGETALVVFASVVVALLLEAIRGWIFPKRKEPSEGNPEPGA